MRKRPVGAVAMGLAIAVLVGLLLADLFRWNIPWLCGEDWQEGQPPDKAPVIVTGRVYRVEKRQSFGSSRLWIYLNSVTINEQDALDNQATVSYQLICLAENEERPRLGSYLQLSGQFELFTQSTNPGQFDIAEYYRTIGIGARIKSAQILKESEEYSVIAEKLYLLQEQFRERLYENLPEKEASILCAMLLGDKTQLDSDIKELYQQSGIIHILSISGLHITILGMGLYKLLRRVGCPVGVAAVLGGVLLILYGMMTGMGISAIRAIGMFLIRMLGEILGRTYDMLTALGIMLIVMVFDNPLYLQHSGFMLSFGSVCGIGLLLPVLSENTGKQNGTSVLAALKKAMLPGISVTIFTLPIQLYFFYEIPVYSILLNLVVLPFVGIIMVIGLVVMTIPGMGFAGILGWLILKAYEWLCNYSVNLPWHSWNPGAPKLWQIICYYAVLAGVLVLHSYKKLSGSIVKPVGKIILLILGIGMLTLKIPPELTVTFLDVGQGDGIVVRTKEEVYLFDCGSSSRKQVGEEVLIPYLKYCGISSLDGVFVSHGDEDHVNGILELLEMGSESGIVIERLILPDIPEAVREQELGNLLDAAAQYDTGPIPVLFMEAGSRWQSGQVSFQCLHPKGETVYSESNTYSMCCLVRYGSFSMLLTGDVEGVGEEALLNELSKEGVNDITVLKIAHHGSRYSTSQKLLERLQPAVGVISCGVDNSYGHPHEELLERLRAVNCRIYQTPLTGAIEMAVKGGKLGVDIWGKMQ